MYKQDVKESFLSQFSNADTKKVYEAVFKKSEAVEKRYNQDIMNFSLEMLDAFIKDYIKPKTKQSARTYCNVLSNYINWSISNNYSKLEVNPIGQGQSYFEQFVKNQNSLYISKEEIDSIVFSLINAQDSFIIKGLFEGIQGKKLSELVNLTIEDVLYAEKNDGNLKLISDDDKEEEKEPRWIKVEKDTLKLAKVAHKESTYYKRNGEIDFSHNIKETLQLAESEYVLKPTKTNYSSHKISYYSIYNRLEMIKSLDGFEEYSDILTSKNIIRSGMLYQAYKIYNNGEILNKIAIEEICKKFGMKYKWSLRDFLNEDTIREVYGLDLGLD